MAEKVISKTYKISNLVKAAKSSQVGPDPYCNHVVATVGGVDLVLDFYQLAPKREDTKVPFAEHRQRIILPKDIVPGLLTLLVKLAENVQKVESETVATGDEDQLDMKELVE